ncbi:MAG: flavin reductase [Chloroflexi bacterium]|nr:flavin reductase [Chloroflexota bacterium]
MTILKENVVIDSRAFRNTIGLFATGVTVVAVEINGEIYGMTANTVTSVSLEPLLVLVCVQKEAHLMQFLRQAKGFSINILSEDQADLSSFFANMWRQAEPPPFTFIPWLGAPRLEGAIGVIACRTMEFFEGGDHWIVTGQVIGLHQVENPTNPLLYYRGQYRRMLDES